MSNRLAGSTSPYLLEHKDNPVDWWPWSQAALDEARRRNIPILLSVGYSSCHWCHVMAKESFEDREVAEMLNAHFVPIKVDREERPDIDAVYMEATIALTGRGGWPMTCLLTPDAKPFFGGTYLPRTQFLGLLISATKAWSTARDGVTARGERISDAVSKALRTEGASELPTAADLDAAATTLVRQFDPAHGGFRGAPKFPPSMSLEFLLRHHERTGDPRSLDVAARTLEAMSRGGIYDQLAGGFARYSVDDAWAVPHFEKMLYDNAQLLRVYLHWWRLTGSLLALRIARETADFLIRDLRTTEGGFAAALDADTNGVEGLSYVWSSAQLTEALGTELAELAAQLFAVTRDGTFERGNSTLQLPLDATSLGVDAETLASLRNDLFAARALRPQPRRDGKVITAWNGLAIAALAEAGALLGEPHYLDAATKAAELICRTHTTGSRLRRSSRDGLAGDALAVAEDFGDLAEGLLALHQATAEPRWLSEAASLLDFALDQFRDPDGGFFDTSRDAENLLYRPQDPTDNAAPSGTTALIHALLTHSALAASPRHREAAEEALGRVAGLARSEPRFLGWGLAAAEAMLAGPVQLAIVGEDPQHGTLTSIARRHRPPGAVIISGDPDAIGVPLLAHRTLVRGMPAAYLCRGFVCNVPATTATELLHQLRPTNQPV